MRQGARMLAKNAGFTATALCTLVIRNRRELKHKSALAHLFGRDGS